MSNNRQSSSTPKNEKIAPNSPEAEEALLGSLLINPAAIVGMQEFLASDDFFIVRNRWAWEAICAVHERGQAVDNLTVGEELRQRGRLEEVGGMAYLTYLMNNTPTHIHAETYGRLVEIAAVRRNILSAAQLIGEAALDYDVEGEELLDYVESTLYNAGRGRFRRSGGPRYVSEIASDFYDVVDSARLGKPVPVVVTGFKAIDNVSYGMTPGELWLLAARPGMGKTSLAYQIAQRNALVRDTIFFSIEMSSDQLNARYMSGHADINSDQFRRGNLTDEQWGRFTEETGNMTRYRLLIDDTPAQSIEYVISTVRQTIARLPALNLVVVDYLQLMVKSRGGRHAKNESREQELSYISRALKEEVARTFKCVVLACAQLNRDVEKRRNKQPILSDLRESGALEQDADGVMFIYRDDAYNENSERPNQADIIFAKNRNGPLFTAPLFFDKPRTLFADLHTTTIHLNDF